MRVCTVALRPSIQFGEVPNTKILSEDLGVSYLSAVLEETDHKSVVIDQAMTECSDEEITRKIISLRPDLILYSESNNTTKRLLSVATKVRIRLEKSIQIIGDIIPSHYADDFILPQMPFDAVCIGEGEETLFEIVKKLDAGKPLDGIPGLLTKKTGRSTYKHRTKVGDINKLPRANRYFLQALTEDERKNHNCMILGSRGCIGNCSFCGTRPFELLNKGIFWRGRDAIDIVDEMEYIAKRFSITSFTFVDSLWVGPPTQESRDRILRFSDEILSRGLKVSFMISSRVDFFRIPDDAYLIQALSAVGLRSIFIGVENGDPATLKLFKKGGKISPEYTEECLKFLRSEGVLPRIGFIMFHPFASKKELEHNGGFLHKIRSDHLMRSFMNKMNLYRHYAIYSMVRNAGLLQGNKPKWHQQSYLIASREVERISKRVDHIYPTFVQIDSMVDKLEILLWQLGHEGRAMAERFQSNVAALYQRFWQSLLEEKLTRSQAFAIANEVIGIKNATQSVLEGLSRSSKNPEQRSQIR